MRRFLLFAILTTLVLGILGVSTGIALATKAPFKPGDLFFALQDFAEQSWANFPSTPAARASFLLTLAERRANDLFILRGGNHELTALNELDNALDRFTQALALVAPEESLSLKTRLSDLNQNIEKILTLLTRAPGENPPKFAAVQAKISTLQKLAADMTTSQTARQNQAVEILRLPLLFKYPDNQAPPEDSTLDPQAVAFLPGSVGAAHAFFPLTGKHAGLTCASCHANGQYAGTPSQCESCHALEEPANHFTGSCVACHNTSGWNSVTFDHTVAGAKDCLSCHLQDKPANHFSGQCSQCHNTSNWRDATFNHQAAGATDCLSCHGKDKPGDHFNGQCSQCHNTSNWRDTTFNHQAVGATDCQSCHTKDRPSSHPSGQCSQCHNTNSWHDAVFDHQAAGATDCQTCHNKNKPANHFSGQCSQCHNTSNWRDATFNHQAVGATDCLSCHSNDRPANHPTGQCSQCHNTSNWRDAQFDHQAAGATDCQSCHANDRPADHSSGQCSQCHNTSNWRDATFNHQAAGATDCQSCHANDRPADHFSGQCSQCHNTDSWGGASFNHDFPINHGNAKGDCAKCHPSGGSEWTCYTCHDRQKMEDKHAEKNITDLAARCLECHPNGRKGED